MKKGIYVLPCLLATVLGANWNANNCGFEPNSAVLGNVTDAICAHYDDCEQINNTNYGSTISKGQACDAKAVCLWNSATNTCGMNRDTKNNVCVPAEWGGENGTTPTPAPINAICHDLTRGYCPREWQVKRGCCTGNASKYDGILHTLNDDVWVCCNLPCEALSNSTSAEPSLCRYTDHTHLKQCGAGARSYFGEGSHGMDMGGGGFKDVQLSPDVVENMFGMNPGKTMSLGMANEGFGFTGMAPQMGINALEEVGVGQSKEHHTEEITVDDLMDVLIEALSKDKDAFDYNREINSDPWFQKQAFGGFTDKFSFIDPWKFIDQIYGTPFGMSQASTTYGNMYGIDKSEFKAPAKGFENVGKVVHRNMQQYGGTYGGGGYGGSQYGGGGMGGGYGGSDYGKSSGYGGAGGYDGMGGAGYGNLGYDQQQGGGYGGYNQMGGHGGSNFGGGYDQKGGNSMYGGGNMGGPGYSGEMSYQQYGYDSQPLGGGYQGGQLGGGGGFQGGQPGPQSYQNQYQGGFGGMGGMSGGGVGSLGAVDMYDNMGGAGGQFGAQGGMGHGMQGGMGGLGGGQGGLGQFGGMHQGGGMMGMQGMGGGMQGMEMGGGMQGMGMMGGGGGSWQTGGQMGMAGGSGGFGGMDMGGFGGATGDMMGGSEGLGSHPGFTNNDLYPQPEAGGLAMDGGGNMGSMDFEKK